MTRPVREPDSTTEPTSETRTPREIHRDQMRELDTQIGDLNHRLKLARAKQSYLRLLRGPMDIVEEPESPAPPEESV